MDAMQTYGKAKTLSELEHHCSEFSTEWEASTDKKDLIKDIEENILPQENISVDSALRLDFGTSEVQSSYCDEDEFDTEGLMLSTKLKDYSVNCWPLKRSLIVFVSICSTYCVLIC
jgi:hypothetical protein